MSTGIWIGTAIAACLVLTIVSQMIVSRRRTDSQQAIRLFRLRREMLEARFFDLAAARGTPRGLRWVRCDWQSDVNFARDIETGLFTAFVGVQIHFEPIEGGELDGVEAASQFREASAVFHYRNGQWGTGGKALMNLSPEEAVTRLAGQYEPVSQSSCRASD